MSLRELAQSYLENRLPVQAAQAPQQNYYPTWDTHTSVPWDGNLAIKHNTNKVTKLHSAEGSNSDTAVGIVAWQCGTAETGGIVGTAGKLEHLSSCFRLSPRRIRCEFPWGLDHVPARHQPAWEALFVRCPPDVTPYVWQGAIFDAAGLFGDFGALIDEYRWAPIDLFDVPHDGRPGGLIWFIKGSPVIAIGRGMAQCQDGRIWRRASR